MKAIAPEKRRELVKSMRQKVSLLDELTKQYWSDSSEKAGWKQVFDYIKIGPYIEKLGPLNKETTNQRLYKRTDSGWEDITKMFWK